MEVRNGSLEMAPYHQGWVGSGATLSRGSEGGQMHFFVLYQVCKAYPTFFFAAGSIFFFILSPKSKHLFSQRARRIPQFTRANGFELQFATRGRFLVCQDFRKTRLYFVRMRCPRGCYAFAQAFAITVATILGTGILALPAELFSSGLAPFVFIFVVCLCMQISVVYLMVELLQHAHVELASEAMGTEETGNIFEDLTTTRAE